MDKIIKKRDIKVEILRIICAFMVIMVHIKIGVKKNDGSYSEITTFVETLIAICVNTFFLITGFFMFNKKGSILLTWWQAIKSFLSKIFIPFSIVAIITIIFNDYFINLKGLVACIKQTNIIDVLNTYFLALRTLGVHNLPPTGQHLWFLFSYIQIVLAFPLIKIFLTKINIKIKYLILILYAIFMLVNEIYVYNGNESLNVFFEYIPKPIYFTCIGYELYNNFFKKKLFCENVNDYGFFINKRISIISFIIYLFTLIIIYKLQYSYYNGVNGFYVFASWLGFFALISSISFTTLIYSINFDKYVNDKIKNIITYISSYTFGIYIIHFPLCAKLNVLGLQSEFQRKLPNVFYHIRYYITYGLLIFIISFVIIFVIRCIKKLLKKGVSYVKTRKLS